MAQLTPEVARAIVAGGGCTEWELYQLCRHWLTSHGEDCARYDYSGLCGAAHKSEEPE